MKILICCNAYPPKFIGGAELIAHYQGTALRDAGHEVRVFAGENTSARQRHAVADDVYDGMHVRRIGLSAQDFSPGYASFSHPVVERRFVELLQEWQPDVVHFHNLIGLSVTIVHLAHEAGAKTVVTLHDHWGFCFKNTAMKTEDEPCADTTACRECQQYIEDGRSRRIPIRMRQDYFRLLASGMDAFVSPSRYLADSYIAAGFPAGRMHVVWNGIDVERFARVRRVRSEGETRFSFIGHFGRHKGVHTLLQALPLLRESARVRINLVGEGEERKEYERLLAANGSAKQVRFWGKVDNRRVEEVYAETDVLVLPSQWRENQPVSITEAMASGCPVIASDMGGSGELIVDGVTGFLFNAGDATQLAEHMSRLVDDPSLLEQMGHQGAARIRPYTFAAQVQELLAIYTEPGRDDVPPQDEAPLVACIGNRVHADAARALDLLPGYCEYRHANVTMGEWLTAGQLRAAQALWVVDPATPVEEALDYAAVHGLPLLVPAASESLVRACRTAGCGLYYTNADEAAASVAYMLSREEDRLCLASAARALRDRARTEQAKPSSNGAPTVRSWLQRRLKRTRPS